MILTRLNSLITDAHYHWVTS